MTATLSPPETPSRMGERPAREQSEGLARSLGWFSIGLGLAEITTPGRIARMVGVRDTGSSRKALLACGVRELATGVAILAKPNDSKWLWARVAGDAIDLALLGRGASRRSTDHRRLATVAAGVATVTLIDVLAGRRLSRNGNGGSRQAHRLRGVHVVRSITVNRLPEEVHRFWLALENLPRFMAHLESVIVLDDRRSHWKAKAPAGASVEWDAEIVEDRPNLIAWRSVPGSGVPNWGSVRFTAAPGGRGTEVNVELRYDPPGGKVGALIARLFGEEPGQQVGADLRRFKQVMELGEVVHSDASIHRGMHPARPPETPFRPELVSAHGGMES